MSLLWLASCRTPVDPPQGPLELVYQGVVDVEGHFRRPGEVHRHQAELRFATDGQQLHSLEMTTWESPDKSDASTEKTWVVGEQVLREGDPPRLLQGEEAEHARAMVLLTAGARTWGHPRLGDVTDELKHGVSRGGAPESFVVTRHELDHQWSASFSLASLRPGGELQAPALASPPPAPSPAPARMAQVAEGVWEVVLEGPETRSLVVELGDSLAVLEASLTSPLAEELVDTIRAQLPDKPIEYVLFSHHHPHYTGGLRAFVAEGATILTPAGSEALVREIARRPFTQAPDRLARSPRELRLQVLGAEHALGDRLQIFDIGAASDHTDHYLVFYLPHAKLLFQGDLAYYSDEKGLRASRRAKGLLAEVQTRGLEVETLMQGWPVVGQPQSVPFSQWKALVSP